MALHHTMPGGAAGQWWPGGAGGQGGRVRRVTHVSSVDTADHQQITDGRHRREQRIGSGKRGSESGYRKSKTERGEKRAG